MPTFIPFSYDCVVINWSKSDSLKTGRENECVYCTETDTTEQWAKIKYSGLPAN